MERQGGRGADLGPEARVQELSLVPKEEKGGWETQGKIFLADY